MQKENLLPNINGLDVLSQHAFCIGCQGSALLVVERNTLLDCSMPLQEITYLGGLKSVSRQMVEALFLTI